MSRYLPLPSGEQPYRVIVGGMPQAGSTLCFNLARLLVESARYGITIHEQDADTVRVLPGAN